MNRPEDTSGVHVLTAADFQAISGADRCETRACRYGNRRPTTSPSRLEGRIEQIDASVKVTNARVDLVDERFERIDVRVDRLEGELDTIRNDIKTILLRLPPQAETGLRAHAICPLDGCRE